MDKLESQATVIRGETQPYKIYECIQSLIFLIMAVMNKWGFQSFRKDYPNTSFNLFLPWLCQTALVSKILWHNQIAYLDIKLSKAVKI